MHVGQLIAAHPVVGTLVGFAVLNSAVQAMEAPTAHSGPGYRYIFRLGHMLAFNFQYALRAKFPEYVPDIAKLPPEPDAK